MIVTVHKAKTELSKLIARAEAGEEIFMARREKPAVKLTPVSAEPRKSRGLGAWKGKATLPDSFFDPLPEEELRAFEGEYEPPA